MNKLMAGAAFAALLVAPLSAQPIAPAAPGLNPVATAATAEPAMLTLPAGAPFTLAVAQEVNSSTHEAGDTFRLTVLNDVRVGETVVIPRGTPAVAEITWKTGKGAFGKSGKMEFALRYLDLKGQMVPISGEYRQEGEGNTVATGVGVIAIGVFAGFITGKRARLPMGRELMAQTGQELRFTADGQLDPAYDAKAAIAAAEAKSPLAQCRARAAALKGGKQDKAVKKCYMERMD